MFKFLSIFLMIVFATFIMENLSAKTLESPANAWTDTNKKLDAILDDLLSELKNTHEQFNLALEKQDDQKAAELQCRKFNIYQQIINFTRENQRLDRSEKYGAAAEILFKREMINVENSKIAKYLSCT